MSLTAAAQRGDSQAVAQLLNDASTSASDVNARDELHSMTPLHWACSCDEVQSAVLFLADPRVDKAATSTHLLTALHHAAVANAMRVLPVLLADGHFKVDAANEWGETPLHLAAAAGHKRAVEALLAARAEAAAKDKWGRTASTVAKEQGLQPVALGLPPPAENDAPPSVPEATAEPPTA
eukprot:7020777-Prymnesium_polylepis.1